MKAHYKFEHIQQTTFVPWPHILCVDLNSHFNFISRKIASISYWALCFERNLETQSRRIPAGRRQSSRNEKRNEMNKINFEKFPIQNENWCVKCTDCHSGTIVHCATKYDGYEWFLQSLVSPLHGQFAISSIWRTVAPPTSGYTLSLTWGNLYVHSPFQSWIFSHPQRTDRFRPTQLYFMNGDANRIYT